MKEENVSTVENNFAVDCIASGFRVDGRRPADPRHVGITLHRSWGHVEVSLDRSRAIASAIVEPITPAADRPNEGVVSVTVELSHASSERAALESIGHRATAQSKANTAELRTIVERIIRESRTIDTEALCILAGVKVWSVRVHVDVIDDDGNAIDVAMLAVVASLLHARHADVTVTGRDVIIHSLDEREPVPVPVHHVPVSVTFALFAANEHNPSDFVAIDPVKREEIASSGSLTCSFSAQGEVCGIYKAGGLPLEPTTLLECAQMASKRAVELTEILNKAMSEAAEHHPLATVRPVLSKPEPVAILQPETEDRKPMAPGSAGGGAWNAAPIPDIAPPRVPLASNSVTTGTPEKNHAPQNRIMQGISGIKVEDRMAGRTVEKVADGMAQSRRKSKSETNFKKPFESEPRKRRNILQEVLDESSDDEDDSEDSDDLMGAVLAAPRGGGKTHS